MPLDIENPAELIAYLRDTNRIGPHVTPSITVLAGGVSNKTVLVDLNDGQAWVLKQALPKLRVAVDWFSDPARIEREARGMAELSRIIPHNITPLIFLDEPNHVLAMQAVPTPHRNWKSMLLAGEVQREHVEAFGVMLGSIHRAGWEGRETFAKMFADRSFFESLRVEPYYLYTSTQAPETFGFIKELVRDTRSRLFTLVHGDYSPKNLLVRDDHLILLDHEVIHFGDPAFDIGFSMTHFLSKGHHLREHRATFMEMANAYWGTYRRTLGSVLWDRDLEECAIRHTLACMLARVAGRSPLEYLSSGERAWQRAAVVQMIGDLPSTMDELIETFLERE